MHAHTKDIDTTCVANKALLQVPALFGEQVIADCEITELESDSGWEQWVAAAFAQGIEVPRATEEGIAAAHQTEVDYIDPFNSVGKKSA